MIGETNRLIKKVKCGYCVDAEDYENLAIKIEKFAKDTTELRTEMAERAFEYYKENFNKEKFIKKLLNIFKEK